MRWGAHTHNPCRTYAKPCNYMNPTVVQLEEGPITYSMQNTVTTSPRIHPCKTRAKPNNFITSTIAQFDEGPIHIIHAKRSQKQSNFIKHWSCSNRWGAHAHNPCKTRAKPSHVLNPTVAQFDEGPIFRIHAKHTQNLMMSWTIQFFNSMRGPCT